MKPIWDGDLSKLNTWEDDAAASCLDSRVRFIEKQQKKTYIELGQILCMFEDRRLWTHLVDEEGMPYTSLEKWLRSSAPVSRAGAYQAMRSLRELKDVPIEDLNQISRANIEVMRLLPGKAKQDPEILEAAKTVSEQDLRRKIKKVYPDAHIEPQAPMRFKPDVSQRRVIDTAFEVCAWVYDLTNREEVFESLATFFLDSLTEQEGFPGMSNAQAFLAFHGEDTDGDTAVEVEQPVGS